MKLLTIWLFFHISRCMAAETRTFYLAMKEIHWNYAPTGMNIISGKPLAEDPDAQCLIRKTNRIGCVYKKVGYFQYNDGNFTEEIAKPAWLGLLGPVIYAEVGDTIIIHLKNMASRPYSVHPHKVEYTKKSEGALYPDNTTNAEKKDDSVQPGETYTYVWHAVEAQGPTKKDDACVTSIYHSHLNSVIDEYTGLVGPMLLCKQGQLRKIKEKIKNHIFLMFSIFDENQSWYLDNNINDFALDPASVDKEDRAFQDCNKMHTINGLMFGNLNLSICNNEEVYWHMFGMGSENDIHSAHFHGQVFTFQKNLVDTVNLFPATMVQGRMIPNQPGKWLLSCQINAHYQAGMQAIYEVKNCTAQAKEKICRERHYYVAAEEIMWNYGPTGKNQYTGQRLDDPKSESYRYFVRNDQRIGGSCLKAAFIQYTDATFTEKKNRSQDEKHLGILGPIIWAEVGERIKMTFKNNARYNFSIQADGVSYTKSMEGSHYRTGNTGGVEDLPSSASCVAPGEIFEYTWDVPSSVSPTTDDQNCATWLYFSSCDVVADTNSGLVGPLVVCKSLKDAKKTCRNFFMLAAIFDENKSKYIDDNIRLYNVSASKNDSAFRGSNVKPTINGFMYGNQPGLEMYVGDKVRWAIMSIGNGMHGIHFGGNNFLIYGTRRSVASIFPHVCKNVIMKPDNPGTFEVLCLVTNHNMGGMKQFYKVKPSDYGSKETEYTETIRFYIAAVEEEWDYSPRRNWEHEWEKHGNDSPGDKYLNRSGPFIGSKYMKALYQGYTDGSFSQQKAKVEKLGLLGPLLIAKEGQKLEIHFKNMASRNYSIYAHGVKIPGDIVKPTKPGDTQIYTWFVPKRSGPQKDGDLDCLTWVYYSKVDVIKDMYSGLVGALVICNDLDQPRVHLPLLFLIFDENNSWYLDENIKRYSLNPEDVDKKVAAFTESNLMHGINGRLYGNLLGLNMCIGDIVYWHIIGLGSGSDLHTVHYHAHSVIYKKNEAIFQSDVIDIVPGLTETVKMIPGATGIWLMHCHVADHVMAGMVTTYTVKDKGTCSLRS
ncbi:ceruloplasmin-like [Discoglossus pictus]